MPFLFHLKEQSECKGVSTLIKDPTFNLLYFTKKKKKKKEIENKSLKTLSWKQVGSLLCHEQHEYRNTDMPAAGSPGSVIPNMCLETTVGIGSRTFQG